MKPIDNGPDLRQMIRDRLVQATLADSWSAKKFIAYSNGKTVRYADKLDLTKVLDYIENSPDGVLLDMLVYMGRNAERLYPQ